MLDLKSVQTFKVISAVLRLKSFSQKEICKLTGVSKGWVSFIVNWLEEHKYIQINQPKYVLVNAGALIALFPLFRKMKKTLSVSIKGNRNKVLKALRKQKDVVFCLTTALQKYSDYYQDPSIHFYSNDSKLLNELATEPKGLMQVNAYAIDLPLDQDIIKKKDLKFTNEVRTIIDLFCDEKAFAVKELIEKKYGGRVG